MKSIEKTTKTAKTLILKGCALIALIGLLAATPALAEENQYDDVYINGYKLGFIEQMFVENFVGQDIEDGLYWLDVDTGDWGPIGSTVQYHVDLPQDYREYIRDNFKQPGQAAQVELTSNKEECEAGCLYW